MAYSNTVRRMKDFMFAEFMTRFKYSYFVHIVEVVKVQFQRDNEEGTDKFKNKMKLIN